MTFGFHKNPITFKGISYIIASEKSANNPTMSTVHFSTHFPMYYIGSLVAPVLQFKAGLL